MALGQRRNNKVYLLIPVVVLLISAVGFYFSRSTKEEEKTYEGNIVLLNQGQVGEVSVELTREEISINTRVLELIESMGIEEKIAQLIITTPEELNNISQVIKAGETTKKKLIQYPVGGIMYSPLNFETVVQMEVLINNTKLFTNYPCFMAIEEEGATKITNTNANLYDVGIHLAITSDAHYLTKENGQEKIEAITISQVKNNGVDLLKGESHMLLIEEEFVSNYNQIVKAVQAGKIEIDTINDKLLKVLEYKLTHGIE